MPPHKFTPLQHKPQPERTKLKPSLQAKDSNAAPPALYAYSPLKKRQANKRAVMELPRSMMLIVDVMVVVVVLVVVVVVVVKALMTSMMMMIMLRQRSAANACRDAYLSSPSPAGGSVGAAT